jgi:hypothetical protein
MQQAYNYNMNQGFIISSFGPRIAQFEWLLVTGIDFLLPFGGGKMMTF